MGASTDSLVLQEFPVVLLRWRTRPTSSNPFNQDLYIAASFQSYVRPTFKPQLSTFCTDLTGITQDTVDKAPKFEDVLQDFEQWLEDNGLDTKAKGDEKDWLWVTDGVRFMRFLLSSSADHSC